jgi:hypothetical protein
MSSSFPGRDASEGLLAMANGNPCKSWRKGVEKRNITI